MKSGYSGQAINGTNPAQKCAFILRSDGLRSERGAACHGPQPGPLHRQIGNRSHQRSDCGGDLPADDAALRAVMFGRQGFVRTMAPKSILIETSTVSAKVSAELAAAAGAHDISYLRAPVSGNACIVHTGALTCFVSGRFREALRLIR
jgi:NAD binding domain of 6-phosphogluconate dehydrogenase